MLPFLLAMTLAFPSVAISAPGGGDDENTPTIEAEILKTLLDNGVITESQYHDLIKKAAKMRKDRVDSHEELSRASKLLLESIQERAAAEAKSKDATSATVSFKNGFYLKSSDGNYSFHPWLVFRERFTYDDIGNVTGLANEDTGSFESRNIRIWLDGNAGGQDLTYLIMFDLASATSTLRDGWLDYKFDNEFHIRAGQQKVPFDYEGLTYGPKVSLVDKSPAVAFFQPNASGEGCDTGAKAWGRFFNNELEWHAGAFNGDGPQNGAGPVALGPGGGVLSPGAANNNDSSGLQAAARVMWMPMGPMDNLERSYFTNGYTEGDYERSKDAKFEVGAFYIYNPERNSGSVPAKVIQNMQTWGADAAFKYDGWFALAEAFVRSTRRDTPVGPNTTDNGYFGQIGYLFGSTPNEGLEAILRWSAIDVDAATLGIVPKGSATEVHDATVGLNYLFNGHRLKLQTAYTVRHRLVREMHNLDDNILQLQLQLIF
ncbi:MAG: hypothetical protein HY286_18645 [Planctomycetes bacterium]|nr:hypothetical protein [Planctomycetota bacterium]